MMPPTASWGTPPRPVRAFADQLQVLPRAAPEGIGVARCPSPVTAPVDLRPPAANRCRRLNGVPRLRGLVDAPPHLNSTREEEVV